MVPVIVHLLLNTIGAYWMLLIITLCKVLAGKMLDEHPPNA